MQSPVKKPEVVEVAADGKQRINLIKLKEDMINASNPMA